MTGRLIAALGAVALSCAFSIPAQAQTAGLNPTGVDPEHYQCYPVSLPTAFDPREVRLKDQFNLSTVRVVNVRFICAPVSKNGALLADTKSHLVCYTIENGLKANKRVEVRNQFGRQQFDVDHGVLLCVPSLKRVLPPPG